MRSLIWLEKNTSYRPDIDGLRAIAVLAVIIFHLFPKILPGGFIGVDVFFVISGYLIASNIFRNLERKSFSFLDFYSRRIKRIFPTLLIILLFTIISGFIIFTPTEYKALGSLIKAATGFISNLYLYKIANYFDTCNLQKPLLHLWSLSIEEQFYIFLPLCLVVLHKLNKTTKNTLIFLLCLLFISFFASVFKIHSKPLAVFYVLKYRAWELLIGVILAYIQFYKKDIMLPNNIKHNIYTMLGFLCLCLSFYYINSVYAETFANQHVYSYWLIVLPIASSIVLINYPQGFINRYLLATTPMRYIGLISYALYLWHWPLLSFMYIYGNTTTFVRIMILFGSFILASINTFYIEHPIRKMSNKISFILIGIMLLFLLFGFITVKEKILPLSAIMEPNIKTLDFAATDLTYPTRNLRSDDPRKFPFHSFGKGEKIIAFIGDSNMEHYWPRVEHLMLTNKAIAEKHTVVFATCPGQMPIPNTGYDIHKKKFLEKAIPFLQRSDISTVVFSAQWFHHLLPVKTEAQAQKIYQDFKELLLLLKKQKKEVFLILNIPINDQQDPHGMFTRSLLHPWKINLNMAKYDGTLWLKEFTLIKKNLVSIAQETNTTIIDPYLYLCPNNICMVLDNNKRPVYRDATHLSASYVRKNVSFLDRIFNLEQEKFMLANSK